MVEQHVHFKSKQKRRNCAILSNKQFETRPLRHRETQQILSHDLKNDSLRINRSIYLTKRKSEEKNVKFVVFSFMPTMLKNKITII